MGVLKKHGHVARFCFAISATVFCLAAFIYVNDMDLVEIANNEWETIYVIGPRMQQKVWAWCGVMQATGHWLNLFGMQMGIGHTEWILSTKSGFLMIMRN
jgi:hypothetical protein